MLRSFVHLIDFVGHPSLNDEYLNNRRYEALHNLIWKNKVFTYTRLRPFPETWSERSRDNERFVEIMEKSIRDKEGTWIEVDQHIDIVELSCIIQEHGFEITPRTNVIIGGTNLSGCILNNKNTSAYSFAKEGFNSQIYLPMCAEADSPGFNDLEKTWSACSRIYDFVKKENLINYIDLVYQEKHLKL